LIKVAYYDYQCTGCGRLMLDVPAPVAKAPKLKSCRCGSQAERYYGNQRNFFSNDMYEEYWPTLGAHVTSKGHKDQLLREKGLIEVADSDGGSKESRIPEGYNGGGEVNSRGKPRSMGEIMEETGAELLTQEQVDKMDLAPEEDSIPSNIGEDNA